MPLPFPAPCVASLALSLAPMQQPADTASPHFPPAGGFVRRAPDAVGMDAAKLAAAIEFARAHPTDWPSDFATQERIFGALLGPMPKTRAATNGIVLRHGYVVAEFGDTAAVDPTYSVAKSLLATVAGVAVREGVIGDLDEPVAARVTDGGYASEHNAKVTWRHHLQQTSEWDGELWGKHSDFVGTKAFGQGAHQPRPLRAPGSLYEYNDVRINRFALSLLRVIDRPVPDVFRDSVMREIGATATWRWVPYDNAFVEHKGQRMASVSGGTRWGGGVWIATSDLARFGYLWLRRGRWGAKQLIPETYVTAALQPSAHGPDYGFLWWLNTTGKTWPGLPTNAFAARGAGNNTIFVSPDHDLVIVWRWHGAQDRADAEFFGRVIGAIDSGGH